MHSSKRGFMRNYKSCDVPIVDVVEMLFMCKQLTALFSEMEILRYDKFRQ